MSEIPQIDSTRADGLNREDFTAKGGEGYRYPFTAETRDYSEAENAPWPGSLDETCRGEDGIYRKEGFDFNEAVRGLKGPAVEVGGPSTGGYEFLSGVDLPEKPIITNISGSRREFKGSESLTAVDALVLNALVDVRAFPFANESLGMVMASSLPQADQDTFREIGQTVPPEQQGPALDAVINESYADAKDALRRGDAAHLRKHRSPAVAVVAQAARVLKPDGLFVWHNLGPRDADIASGLGLELVMHAPMASAKWEGGTVDVIPEAVFRKTALRPDVS